MDPLSIAGGVGGGGILLYLFARFLIGKVFNGIKQDIRDIKEEIRNIKSSMSKMNEELGELKGKVEVIEKILFELKNNVHR